MENKECMSCGANEGSALYDMGWEECQNCGGMYCEECLYPHIVHEHDKLKQETENEH